MSSIPVTIRKIETPRDFKAFFEFPWVLYKDDLHWVPPLVSVRKELLDREKGPAWEYIEGELFGAWRGEQMVGTIAGFVSHRHNQFNDDNVGWFGFFEVYDDQEAATALLNAAAEWVFSHGYDAILGPANMTLHEECGLLIENFDDPVILMPYNKSYYQKLVENAGFGKSMDVVSFYFDREMAQEAGAADRMAKITKRARERSGITIRPIDAKRKKEEFQLFRDLYNDAWINNWGFVPMTDRELDALVESLGQFFDPSMAFFAEVNGEPAGFALAIPNFNEVLKLGYPRPGTPEIFTLLKVLWYWKVQRVITGTRLPLLGVKQEYRDTPVVICLIEAVFRAITESRYGYIDCGWVLETNPLVKLTTTLGLKIYKTHRFYQQDAPQPLPEDA
ncbi:hypothetical protein G4Y79_20335 [Phototrophicus methaneseepsis]|uniref:N-acetyltransferase domain-containing protein n=1 Tax=Phototrophicus methaneseepsis TaxID=2710758 RepID=A0A7S8E7X5_9CHLR|nr:hypothetical protein [Phototrophicus methaneseepsis]QPC82011.1 hypothetical protein G4Y79_20335 [Phototrophicus methaneseepsis]